MMDSQDILEYTNINGRKTVCLRVAGEPRVFISHLLENLNVDGYTKEDVLFACKELNINFRRSIMQQFTNVENDLDSSCLNNHDQLITKSDAERLCGALLKVKIKENYINCTESLSICHDCFGGCKGNVDLDLYLIPSSPCIECLECHRMLSPQQFVAHSHSKLETNVKHWGFSSSRWRSYVFLSSFSEGQTGKLDEIKRKFLVDEFFTDYTSGIVKAKMVLESIIDNISSHTKIYMPGHLCTEEPIITDTFSNSYMQSFNCAPNVSLALFDCFGNSNSTVKKKSKNPSLCSVKNMQDCFKCHLNPSSRLCHGLFKEVPFNPLREPGYIEMLLNKRKELFTILISKSLSLNKQQIWQEFDLMQKHGTDLVYFLLENKTELVQKLKLCDSNG